MTVPLSTQFRVHSSGHTSTIGRIPARRLPSPADPAAEPPMFGEVGRPVRTSCPVVGLTSYEFVAVRQSPITYERRRSGIVAVAVTRGVERSGRAGPLHLPAIRRNASKRRGRRRVRDQPYGETRDPVPGAPNEPPPAGGLRGLHRRRQFFAQAPAARTNPDWNRLVVSSSRHALPPYGDCPGLGRTPCTTPAQDAARVYTGRCGRHLS